MYDLSERISCSDGTCTGIINERGVCNICGKPLKGCQERGTEEDRERQEGRRNRGGKEYGDSKERRKD